MNIYMANVPGLKLIPVGYVSDVDNQYHYIGDFVSNQALLTERQSVALLIVPTETNPLYLPILTNTTADGNTTTIFGDKESYNEHFLSMVDQSIADTLWDYLIQVHTVVVADGVFQNFGIVEYNQYLKEFTDCRDALKRLKEGTPVETEIQKESEPEPEQQVVQQEEVSVEQKEEVEQEVQPQVETTTQSNIVAFGNENTTSDTVVEADEYENDMSDDDVIVAETGIDLEYVKTIDKGFIKPVIEQDFISINAVTEEQIEEMRQQVTNHVVDTVYAPAFVPRVLRYFNGIHVTTPTDENVESVLSAINYETFVELVKRIQDNDLNELMFKKRQAYQLALEIERRLCRGKLPVKELLKYVDNSSPLHLTYEILYDLLKYYVVEESPNGLYDNCFLLPYLMRLEFTLRGIKEEEIDSVLMFMIMSWCIREEELIVTEISGKNEDGDDDGEDTFSMDIGDTIVSKGQTLLRDAINGTILGGEIPFILPTVEGLTPIQNICISAVYGISMYVKGDLNHLLRLRGWSIQLEEYGIKSSLLGIPINTYVVVWCLGNAMTDIEAITQVVEPGKTKSVEQQNAELAEINSAVAKRHYNETLRLLKGIDDYAQDLVNENPVIYLSEYDMEALKYVFVTVGNRHYCVGAIARVNNLADLSPDDLITNKYVFLPVCGSYFGELLDNGIKVTSYCESYDDLKYLGRAVENNKIKHRYLDIRIAKEIATDKSKILRLGSVEASDVTLDNIKTLINKVRVNHASDIVYNKVKVIPNARYESDLINRIYANIVNSN